MKFKKIVEEKRVNKVKNWFLEGFPPTPAKKKSNETLATSIQTNNNNNNTVTMTTLEKRKYTIDKRKYIKCIQYIGVISTNLNLYKTGFINFKCQKLIQEIGFLKNLE